MASRKSAGKPAKKPRGKPFVKGERDPRQGNGPAKGEGGRPPEWWKERMRSIRDRFLIAAEAEGVVDNPDHPQWAKVGTWAHEQLEGRAKQHVEVEAGEKTLEALLAQSHAVKPADQ